MTRQQGMSLLEVLFAMLLSSVLMSALIQGAVVMKKHMNQAEALLNETHEMDVALSLLRSSVRHAGFTPCVGLKHLLMFDSLTQRTLHAEGINVSAQGERLTVSRMHQRVHTVLDVVSPTHLVLKGHVQWERGKTVLYADCVHAGRNVIAALRPLEHTTEVILKYPLHDAMKPPFYIGLWVQESFFVQKDASHQPALFYQQHHVDMLTPEITNVHFQIHQDGQHTRLKAKMERRVSAPIEWVTTVRCP